MISKKDVNEEIITPQIFDKAEDLKFLWSALYKAVYMCLRLLLDIRYNQVQMAEKLNIKLETKKDNTPRD